MEIVILDIGGTSIKYAKCIDGEMYKTAECESEAGKGGVYLMHKVIEIIRMLGPCDGIGISTAGQVDAEKGCIRYANDNIPGYTGMEIRKVLENEFGVPAAVENDVNSAALGEGIFGAARGRQEYLCLTYGTGVGGAFVTGGRVFRGFAGSAGEFGSMIIHGRDVRPGVRISGCYEDYASTSVLVRKVSEKFPQIADGKQVFQNIHLPEIRQIVEEWVQEIAHGLVTLIHIFNPRCVILGGGIMARADVVDMVRESVRKRIMSSFDDVEILAAVLGNQAGLWGAFYAALQRVEGVSRNSEGV